MFRSVGGRSTIARSFRSVPISRRPVVGLLTAGLLMPAGQALAEARTLSGKVVYRERMMLPAGAVVEVKLLDVSLADAPARTIAEARITDAKASPIPYTLRYDSAQIEPRRTYALQARIQDGDRLLFINTTRHAVFAGGKDDGEIQVEHVAGQVPTQPASSSPVGRWLAEDIRSGGVIDNLQSVLEIAADGAVTGSGGCNRMRGQATIAGTSLTFGAMITTRMACSPAVMDQESKFLSVLEAVRSFRIDPQQHKLFLLDAAGQTVMRLAAM
ncbi:MAG: META domain-containing protein [Reyranella sp.]|nr:MAG: META domain-containing protein [Reyranella sp.]